MPLFDNVVSVPAAEEIDNSVKPLISVAPIEQKIPVQQKAITTSVLDAAIADGEYPIGKCKTSINFHSVGIKRGVSKAMRQNNNRPVRSSSFYCRGGKPNHSKIGRGSRQANQRSGKLNFCS